MGRTKKDPFYLDTDDENDDSTVPTHRTNKSKSGKNTA